MEVRLKFPNFLKRLYPPLSRNEQTDFNAYVNMLRTIEIISRFQSPQYCQQPNWPNLSFYKDSPKSWAQVALETWTRKSLRKSEMIMFRSHIVQYVRFLGQVYHWPIITYYTHWAEWAEVSAQVSGVACQIAVTKTLRAVLQCISYHSFTEAHRYSACPNIIMWILFCLI